MFSYQFCNVPLTQIFYLNQDHLKSKDYEHLQSEAKKRSQHGVLIVQVRDDLTWKLPIAKHLPETVRQEMAQSLEVSQGDMLLVAAGPNNSMV